MSFWCRPTERFHRQPTVVGADGESYAHLPGREHDVGGYAADRHPPEYGRDLQVIIAEIVRGHLLVPKNFAGLPVEGDQAVRVQVRARTAGPVRVVRRAREGPRVGDCDENPALGIGGTRVPQPAAEVDVRMSPQAGILDRAPLPPDRARTRVERVDGPCDTRLLAEKRGVERHSAGDHHAVDQLRRDVDPAMVVCGQLTGPHLRAGARVQREHAGRGDAVDAPVAVADSVGAGTRDTHLMLPSELAGVRVDCGDVGVQLLYVHGPIEHDRLRGDDAPKARAGQRVPPRGLQPGHVAGIDRRAGGVPRVGQVVVVAGPSVGVAAPFRGWLAQRGGAGRRATGACV